MAKKYYRKANKYGLGDALSSAWKNAFSDDTINEGLSYGMGAAGTLFGQGASSLISGGRSSGVGNTIGTIGRTIGGALSKADPILGGAFSLGTGVFEGAINNLIGSKINQKRVNQANQEIGSALGFNTNAGDFDVLLSEANNAPIIQNFSKSDLGSEGMLSDTITNLFKELKQKGEFGNQWVASSIENQAQNIANKRLSQQLASSYALGGNLFSDGGGIYIKPSKRGTFTAAAKKHGKSVQAFASQVLANKENYSPAMRKKAQFAKNAAKFKHKDGGPLDNLVADINTRSKADFVQRLLDPNRAFIQDWATGGIATHKLGWATDDNGEAIVFPSVQRINGELYDFTDPKNGRGKWDAYDSAVERGDTLKMTPKQADEFTKTYKSYYPKGRTFEEELNAAKWHDEGGPLDTTKEELTPRERLNIALGRTPNGRPLEQGLINVYPELMLNPKSLGGAASSALENMGLSFGKKATVKTLRGLVNGTKFLQRVEDKIDNTVYGTLNSARDKAIKSTPQYEQSIQDATKRVKTIYKNSKKANIFPSLLQNDSFNSEPTNEYSFGGELTNGGVFSNGTTIIGNGGRHEENPYDGVQVGMDQEGIPDLVEQGELIWNGYVFSDRLIVPKAVRQKYKLGNKDLTFAEAARKIQKESEERPNDPISKNGLEATLSSLMMEQEIMKQEQQGNKYSKGGRLYDGLGPEPSFLKSTPHTIDKMKPTPLSANLNDKISPFSAYGVTFGQDRPLLSGETKLYSKNVDNYAKTLKKEQQGVTDNWMRYAPIAGSVAGLGYTLFNRPDYTGVQNVERAANEIANIQKVGYTPIEEYLTYKPFDTDYYITKLQAQAGANRRALANQAGGNRAAATASLLALDQDTIGKIGDLARQAEESNLAQKQQVSTFNRATKQANAEMGLKAAMANQEALMKARQARLSGISSAEAMRDTIDARRSAALSAGITGLFDNLGSAGKEKLMMDIVNNNPALLYTFFGNYKNKSSKGGKLNQKRGGFTY